MKKLLLFPAKDALIENILKKTYQVIPVNTAQDLQNYIWIAEVLIIDATIDSQKAVNFLNEICHYRDFDILVYMRDKETYAEEEFLKLGVRSVIKENYSINTIERIIDQAVKNVKDRKELKEPKTSRSPVCDISRIGASSMGAPQNILLQTIQQKEVLKNFSKILAVGYDLKSLLGIFINVIQEMLKVSKVAIFLEEEGVYKIRAYNGISPGVVEHIFLQAKGAIVDYLTREGTVLRLDSLELDSQIITEMRSIGVTIAVPLWEQGRLIGIIAFNKKITGLPITDEELELIFVLGSHVAVAIENTSLLELISKQRNYLESILNHVSCGVITINANNTVTTYNPKAEEILGINRGQVVGKHINLLPHDITVLLEETVRTGSVCFRKELKLAELGKFIGVSITPIMTNQGDITGSVMIFTDISPIKALEEETRNLDRLEFTNTVAMRSSHELKNCLVSIKTFAQLLPERYMDKQFREDFYLVMNKEVDRLNQLVENLLFFAQPLQLDCNPYNIEELLRETIEVLEKEDMLLGVEIVKEFAHRMGMVDIDKDAMLRAIRAIIHNSIQALPKGGKIRIVTCDVSSEQAASVQDSHGEGPAGRQDLLELKIIDHGTGIPQELINKVWEPFFTTKTRGIGLGLTIVRKIIEVHGGSIVISSHLHKGTEISIFLPRVSQPKKGKTLFFPGGRAVAV